MRIELAALWQRILQTDPADLFETTIGRLQNRSWGDQLAQPGYVGPNYQRGGLAFVSMNPGGGRGSGLGPEDLLQYEALTQLRDCTDAELAAKFPALTEIFQKIMPTWKIIQRLVDPILNATGIPFSSIAYFNLLKWRASDSSNLSKLYDLSWRDHTGPLHFDVIPRVIGNNIAEPGKEAIRRICGWLSAHPAFAGK
jgi:hypothetical protein